MSLALPQKTRALRLYRHALKNCLSWAISRDVWYDEINRIRGEFEKTSAVKDKAAVERLLKKGEKELLAKTHPDPYIVPYYYGGSSYARNPPFPKEMHQQLDFGREDYK